jgi:hypothetical protein
MMQKHQPISQTLKCSSAQYLLEVSFYTSYQGMMLAFSPFQIIQVAGLMVLPEVAEVAAS